MKMDLKSRLNLARNIGLFVLIELCLFFHFDQIISNYVRQMDVDHHSLINVFRAYTDFGKSFWYLWPFGIGAILIAIDLRDRRAPQSPKLREGKARLGRALLFLFLTISVSGLITDAIKPIIGRARPVLMEREHIYGLIPFSFHSAWNSMPSGHSTTAFALAFTLIILLPRWRFVWLGIGFVLALSRVMVNAHYVSDVVAGAAVAYVTTIGIRQLLAKNGMVHIQERIFPIDRKNPTH